MKNSLQVLVLGVLALGVLSTLPNSAEANFRRWGYHPGYSYSYPVYRGYYPGYSYPTYYPTYSTYYAPTYYYSAPVVPYYTYPAYSTYYPRYRYYH